jgi:orotidine-5'-phosphate decarboxylase
MTEVIVALDVDSIHQEESLLKGLEGTIAHFKIGLRLFTAHGKRAVDLVHRHGGRIFLDIKLHDIPQTVAHAVREAQKMGVHSVSLHLAGGADMVQAAAAVHPRPKLWGVTVLTSLSSADLRVLHPQAAVHPVAARLSRMGLRHGADGLICSCQDVPYLRKALKAQNADPCFITPGIRPENAAANDQKRHVPPAEAARLGVRYAVIGRPITHAADPRAAAQDIIRDMRISPSEARGYPSDEGRLL